MKADTRRYSITVTNEMDADLNAVKQQHYSEESQREILPDTTDTAHAAWKASEREIQ